MNENNHKMIRLTGIAGLIAAICWTIGDALLLGSKVTAEQYPILAEYAGRTDIASQVVLTGIQFFGSSPQRLAAGALVAVFSTPLYLAGMWHIYLALKSAGKWSSRGPLVLLFTAFTFAPFVHGSFYYVAEMVKMLPAVDEAARVVIIETATRATTVLFGTYAILAVLTLAGFVWMIVTVARGKTLYPRWVAIANPIVLMVIGSVSDRVMPYPLSLWLEGAGLNIGMLLFFAMSLVLLWKPRTEAHTESIASMQAHAAK
jgi:hypothetical protein